MLINLGYARTERMSSVLTILIFLFLLLSIDVCYGSEDNKPLISTRGSVSLYSELETSSLQDPHVQTEIERKSCLDKLVSRFDLSNTRKKYACIFATTVCVVAIGITLWKLLSHYANPDHQELPPSAPNLPQFWPVRADMSDTTKVLFANLSMNETFFVLLSLLWGNATTGFDAIHCIRGNTGFNQTFEHVSAILNQEVNAHLLRNDVSDLGTIVCNILPTQHEQPALFSCKHNATFSDRDFGHIPRERLCPTSYGVLNTSQAIRLGSVAIFSVR